MLLFIKKFLSEDIAEGVVLFNKEGNEKGVVWDNLGDDSDDKLRDSKAFWFLFSVLYLRLFPIVSLLVCLIILLFLSILSPSDNKEVCEYCKCDGAGEALVLLRVSEGEWRTGKSAEFEVGEKVADKFWEEDGKEDDGNAFAEFGVKEDGDWEEK